MQKSSRFSTGKTSCIHEVIYLTEKFYFPVGKPVTKSEGNHYLGYYCMYFDRTSFVKVNLMLVHDIMANG